MNRTHYLLTACLGALLMLGGLSGCIKEDRSDCPEPTPAEGSLQLALTYTRHNTLQRASYADLFAQQVRKVDVFVFDETDRLVQQLTEQAQPVFADNYTKAISLPAGDYRFVVWGNLNFHAAETAHNCLAPKTPFAESRLALQALQSGTRIPMLADSLFHGYTSKHVTVVAGEHQTVPIDLMKDRNDIRVVAHWHAKDATQPCTHVEHAAAITAEITDRNAAYDFANLPLAEPEVTYLPGRFAAHYNPAFHGQAKPYPTECPYLYVADFSVLRLMLDHREARLVLRKGDRVVYDRSLLDLITQVEQYRTQEALDREDRYLIELEFECPHAPDQSGGPEEPNPPVEPEDTWVALSITINGWRFVDRPVEL